MIISIDAEKNFDKAHHPFMIKTQQACLERSHFNIIKPMYEKPITNIIPNNENWEPFSKIRNQDKDVHFHHFYLLQYWNS